MRGLGRFRGLMMLAGAMGFGCHGGEFVAPPPIALPIEVELPTVTKGRIEPDPATLSKVDTDVEKLPVAGGPFREMSEETCRQLAAARSAVANLLDAENQRPTSKEDCSDAAAVLREARGYAARDARNRAAADALDRFYQLADAEARAELLVLGLTAFDQLRTEAGKLRAAGLPAPADDDLARQRVKLLVEAEQGDAGIQLLNIDLKARLGLATRGTARLWPTGDFAVPAGTVDTDAAVQSALENRPDLQMLRTLYHGLSGETLSAAQDLLRGMNRLLGASAGPPSVLVRLKVQFGGHSSPKSAELETRRRQLFELIAERERLAAAEVRAAVVSLDSASRRVALTAARVASWKAKVDAQGPKNGRPAEVLQAEVEWYKARAELVVEVMAWHRARVKLDQAVGR